ncbi:MAG: filamin/ABP280 repeat domain-containing protein [Gemmatimonadota bacterium]
MHRPALAALAAVAVLIGCDSGQTPLTPEAQGDRADDFVVQLSPLSAGFSFAPPLASLSVTDPFDATLAPRVEVCEGISNPCSSVLVEFTTQTSPSVQLFPNEELYGVKWNTGATVPQVGVLYRVRALVGPLELGSVDVVFTPAANGNTQGNSVVVPNAVSVPAGSVLPVLFRIEQGALPVASGCVTNPAVLDCDVIQVPVSQGGVVQVGNPTTQEFAGEVSVAAGDALVPNGEPHFVLTLEHIAPPPGVQLSTPWVPFFVRATAKDSDGNDVTFQTGADVVLCQTIDLEDPQSPSFLPDVLHPFLQIVRVHNNQAFPLVTTFGAPQCAGPGSAPSMRAPRLSWAGRVSAGLGALASLVRPQRLVALHGGLNTRGVGGFSEFGATLPVDPAASTASVPSGTSGATTVITLQTAVAPGVPHPTGGGTVAGVVSGANAGAPVSVVNHKDGTYSLSYTPAQPGSDQIEITIDGNAVSGSPFTSSVAPNGFGTPVIDGVKSPGEWDQAQAIPVFAGPYAGSTLLLLNDAGSLYVGLELPATPGAASSVFRIRFDNGSNGVSDTGDDELRVSRGRFQDLHFDGTWRKHDRQQDGTGESGASAAGVFHELAHPLASGDPSDFSLGLGTSVGYCLVLLENERMALERQYPTGCAVDATDQTGYALLTIAGPPN